MKFSGSAITCYCALYWLQTGFTLSSCAGPLYGDDRVVATCWPQVVTQTIFLTLILLLIKIVSHLHKTMYT